MIIYFLCEESVYHNNILFSYYMSLLSLQSVCRPFPPIILYYNPCNNLSTLTLGSYTGGVTVVNDTTLNSNTFKVLSAVGAYGYYNTGSSLLGKTILIDVNTTALCDIFFGCNSSGAGFMLRIDSRPEHISYISTIVSTNEWNSYGLAFTFSPALTTATETRILANTWYKFVISISSTGEIRWIARQRGATNNINGKAYYSYSDTSRVSASNTHIGIVGDGAGPTFYTLFDNITIVNGATLFNV